MLVLVVCIVAVVSPVLAGRWPAGLLLHRWRWSLLVWAALALQIVVIDVPLPGWAAEAGHVGSYVLALTFAWLNRRSAGVLIVGAGALLNGVTIALNGGVLPASAAAVEAAGMARDHEFANSAVLADPVLPWLGDVFAWPDPMPLANTFSIGDVLIVVGVAVAAWAGSRRIGRPAVDEPAADAQPSTADA